MFRDSEILLGNPTEHTFVPKCTKLNLSEIQDVMSLYHVTEKTQFQKFTLSNIVVRFLGFETGDVVKIERTNPNSGIEISYRLVTISETEIYEEKEDDI